MTREPILIVDDNPSNTKLLRVLLVGAGYPVDSATDGAEMLDAIARTRPSVILMDLQLPGVDGLELTRRLKASPSLRDIVVIAVTANAMKGDSEKAREAGCDGFITKPIDTRTFVDSMRRYIDSARSAQRPSRSARMVAARPVPVALIVEDNRATARVLRTALEAEGCLVHEATSGAHALEFARESMPTLVTLDLILPDMDGTELARALRALPGGGALTVIACSGFLTQFGEAHLIDASFDEVLFKPVDRHQVAAVVRPRLAVRMNDPVRRTMRRSAIVVDDNPVQLKLTALLLGVAGFQVRSASSGNEALKFARQETPDVILSDVLMPEMDGFELCQAVRADSTLSRTHVVLISQNYVSQADAELARKVGASGYVVRSVSLREAIGEVERCLVSTPPRPEGNPASTREAHTNRALSQLDRQVIINGRLARTCSVMAAQLTVLNALGSAMAQRDDTGAALRDALADCFDAAQILFGLLYMPSSNGGFEASVFGTAVGRVSPHAGSFFEAPDLLEQLIVDGVTTRIPSPEFPADWADRFLATCDLVTALVTPVRALGRNVGLLVLGSRSEGFGDEWAGFAESLAGQIGQAWALGQAYHDRASYDVKQKETEEQLLLAERLASMGVLASSTAHEINNPLTAILGYVDLAVRSLDAGMSEERQRVVRQGLLDARAAGEHIRQVTEDLRRFIAASPAESSKFVDPREVSDFAIRMATSEIKHRATVVREYGEVPFLALRRSHLAQVLLNLVVNAAQAIPEGRADAHQIRVSTRRTSDGSIEIQVADNGPGMSEEVRRRIFQPFFTTKESGTGPGHLDHRATARHARGGRWLISLRVSLVERLDSARRRNTSVASPLVRS